MRRICIFCGSNHGIAPAYDRAAHEIGVTLAEPGLGLVYGGGNVGLMGVVADAVLGCGGNAVGVIPQALVDTIDRLLQAKPSSVPRWIAPDET
jgi:uncharacterized protein (TIGR00730 family)